MQRLKRIISIYNDLKEVFNLSISKQKQFYAILEIAKIISKTNPLVLIDLVKLLGRKYQYYHINKVIKFKNQEKIPDLEAKTVWFDEHIKITPEGLTLYKLKNKVQRKTPLKLNYDIILPWPWNRNRIVKCLCYIGKNRPAGEWKEDDNHKIEFWWPIGIGWVKTGNHSITAGIALGEGEITDYITYDISPVYEHVECDGLFFIRKDDKKVLSLVKDVEFAAIFEIGRLMKNLNVYT